MTKKSNLPPASKTAQSPSSREQSRNTFTKSMLQMAQGINSKYRRSENVSELKCSYQPSKSDELSCKTRVKFQANDSLALLVTVVSGSRGERENSQ